MKKRKTMIAIPKTGEQLVVREKVDVKQTLLANLVFLGFLTMVFIAMSAFLEALPEATGDNSLLRVIGVVFGMFVLLKLVTWSGEPTLITYETLEEIEVRTR